MFVFDVPLSLILGVLISSVMPLLVGLVTKTVTNPGRRALLLALLTTITGLLTELAAAVTQEVPYNLGIGLLTAFSGFLAAVAMHYGLFKPTGLAEKLQEIGSPHSSTTTPDPYAPYDDSRAGELDEAAYDAEILSGDHRADRL